MDNYRLCSIVSNLQQRLSDKDRERLDLYLKNDIPKPVRDDSTLGGTLKLIQSLFDQNKINEKDFPLLIDAFKQIQCFDAVNLLEGFFLFLNFISFNLIDVEHQRRILSSGLNQSPQSFASIMPSNIQQLRSNNEYDDGEGYVAMNRE
jgi:hypothetical protein